MAAGEAGAGCRMRRISGKLPAALDPIASIGCGEKDGLERKLVSYLAAVQHPMLRGQSAGERKGRSGVTDAGNLPSGLSEPFHNAMYSYYRE